MLKATSRKKSCMSTILTDLGLLLAVVLLLGLALWANQRVAIQRVRNSGHLIQHDDPDAILTAINDLAQTQVQRILTDQ